MDKRILNLVHRPSCILVACSIGFLGACVTTPRESERFTYVIDGAVQPSQAELPGLDGGPPRPVGAVIGPDGTREEFVINEVVFHPESPDELDAFLAKYGGTVLRDGSPFLIPDAPYVGDPEPSGFYLIRVDLKRSSLSDIAPNMEAAGVTGPFRFSSEDAVRLAALIAREKDRVLSANPLVTPLAVVPEHPVRIPSLDAFVGNFLAPNQVWFNGASSVGSPSGSFRDSGQALGGHATRGVALAFLDNNPGLDAFVANAGGFTASNNKVWLNDGSGTFIDTGQNLGASDSQGVALGALDVVPGSDAFVVNAGAQPNKVWLNDGSGIFNDSGQNLGASDSQGVALRDLDGDSDLDAFVVNAGGQPNKVWLNDGSGTFIDSGQNLGASGSQGVALGDLDGDFDVDAFVANGGGGANNRVWINDGSGIFIESGQKLGGSVAVALGNFAHLANVDAATFPWMIEDDDPFTSGAQGLSVGVIHAWDYLRYHGLPPSEGEYTPPIVALIDRGFALDTTTGVPLNNNIDYNNSFNPPLQMDLVDHDTTAGGQTPEGVWHGQSVFGVAAAYPRNLFGSAGTGGDVVRPMLVKLDPSGYGIGDAIRSAYLNGADVISLSAGFICGIPNWVCGIPPDDILSYMQNSVLLATTGGAVVVASAGNDGVTRDGGPNIMPCKRDQVICVGSVQLNSMTSDPNDTVNLYNFGSFVDIWAPTGIRTTPNPDTASETGIDVLPPFWGTSASTPFVAGIVGLMKALDPSLRWHDIQTILQDTANDSPADEVTGYVDAFRAVEQVRPNQPPTVNITTPADGASVSHGKKVSFLADVIDPESEDLFQGELVFSSDLDGELCTAPCIFEASPQLSVGTHEITATAIDPFGAIGTDSITLHVVNHAPTATITQPPTGSTFFTSQLINFRGFGFDVDESIPDANLVWTSDIVVGPFGAGKDFFISLPEGTHTVTLTATDAFGLMGEDSITVIVEVGEGFPTAQILSPANNASFPAGALITFEGEGIDPEEGALTGSALDWSSDFDGPIGVGNTFDVVLSSGPGGELRTHTITLRVTDSDGHVSMHSIVVHVGVIF